MRAAVKRKSIDSKTEVCTDRLSSGITVLLNFVLYTSCISALPTPIIAHELLICTSTGCLSRVHTGIYLHVLIHLPTHTLKYASESLDARL